MFRRSSKRFKASFIAEPHDAAMALPLLLELRDGFFDLHKNAFDAAYFAFLAGSSPVPSSDVPTVSRDVVAPSVKLVASVTPKRAHPEVTIDLPVSSSDDSSSDEDLS